MLQMIVCLECDIKLGGKVVAEESSEDAKGRVNRAPQLLSIR